MLKRGGGSGAIRRWFPPAFRSNARSTHTESGSTCSGPPPKMCQARAAEAPKTETLLRYPRRIDLANTTSHLVRMERILDPKSALVQDLFLGDG
eukprot:2722514-Rhodomonas_salina.2